MPLLTDRLDVDELALMAWLAMIAGRGGSQLRAADIAKDAYLLADAFKEETEKRAAATVSRGHEPAAPEGELRYGHIEVE